MAAIFIVEGTQHAPKCPQLPRAAGHSKPLSVQPTTSSASDPDAPELDPRDDERPFLIEPLALEPGAHEPARSHRFRVLWSASGHGALAIDAASHRFGAGSLLFVTPYQHLRFECASRVSGTWVEFHANFLCVETFHAEVGCSSVLFNDPYGVPAITLEGDLRAEVVDLFARLEREQLARGLAHDEVSVAYMKVVLVLATRRKLAEGHRAPGAALDERDELMVRLRDAIEASYCTLHAPSDYAALLGVTPKTLGRIVRARLGKTVSALIQERILVHAKWQLLHTLRPVKAIAHELGFADELYFSRLFKKHTGVSPTFFRQVETELRGGSNLSMPLRPSPMPDRA